MLSLTFHLVKALIRLIIMQFEKNYLYHIYNQGNNRRIIFFKDENYHFFLKKIKTYVLPYADILAYCLMPNHFHLMVLVKEIEISQSFTPSEKLTTRSLNHSIGIMLRSFTRAINKQEDFSGALFRKETKAECVNCPKGMTPSFIKSKINFQNPEKQYAQLCFNYIHQNPVKAKLVQNETDWEYSSAKDYMNMRNGQLINKIKAFEYIDLK